MDVTKIQDNTKSNNLLEISDDSVLDKSCIKASSNVSVAGTESTEGSCQAITSETINSESGLDYAKYPNITNYIQPQPDIGCIPVKPSLTRLNDLLPENLRQKDIEVYETNFDEILQHLFRQAINADAKIAIGSKEFPCHLVLLQSYSKYLQRIKRPPETVYRFELPEEIISEKHFPSLMNWILLERRYKRNIIKNDNVVPLYAAGHFLEIPDLMEECWEFMSEAMQNNDPIILHLYEQAKCPKFKQLRNVFSAKLAEMFDVLYKSRQFLSLDLDDFIVILDSDDVNILSELDIFHAASRWLLYDWDNRSQHTIRLMKCVRFGLLTTLQLTQIRHCPEVSNMSDYSQIFSFSEVKDMLNDGLTYAIFLDNFESHSEELSKWLDWSNVNHPRKRNCLKGAAINDPNPSAVSSVIHEVNKHISIHSNFPNVCKSKSSTRASKSILKTSTFPSTKFFVDEVDDPKPLLSNRRPPQVNTRQSTIQNPFTLASVLRSRIEGTDDRRINEH